MFPAPALTPLRCSLAATTLILTLVACKSQPVLDDTAATTAVQTRLSTDAAIAAEPIQATVQSGVATLQGAVSSPAARALAASDAAQVPGIRTVVNNLTVAAAQPPVTASTAPPQQPYVAPTPLPSRDRKPSPIHPDPTPRRSLQPPSQQAQNNQPDQSMQPAPIERRPLSPSTTPDATLTLRQSATQAFRDITIPAGTTLSVRITQTLDSATTQQGDSFSGTLASDVNTDGLIALATGTNVSGRVDAVHEAAHFKGAALLTISLNSLSHRGDRTTITTDPYTAEGKGRGTNTAEKVGGGAAVGAILGGIFGGGKGAAIGAATGGGIGAGAQGITRGQQVQIPSESLIRFRLTNPVSLRVPVVPSADGDRNLQPRNPQP